MALQLYPSSGEHVTLVLAADPSMKRENDEEALRKYMLTGDASELTVPDDASRITVRPLTSRATIYAQRDEDLASWRILQCSVERISDLPDLEPAMVGDMRLYPGEGLDRLPAAVCAELVVHIAQISNASMEGKAS